MSVKIDVTQPLTTLDGKPLYDSSGYICEECGHEARGELITLRSVCETALMGRDRNAKPLDGKEQVKRYELALRIHSENEIILENKDAALLQELVAGIYAPLVTGQVWLLLEGESE